MEHSRPIQPSDENPKNGTRLKSNKMSTSYMVDGGGGGSRGERSYLGLLLIKRPINYTCANALCVYVLG